MASERQQQLSEQLESLNRIQTLPDMQTALSSAKMAFEEAAGVAYDDLQQRKAAEQPDPEIVLSYERTKPTTILMRGIDRSNLTIHVVMTGDKGMDFSRFCLTNGKLSAIGHGFWPINDKSLVRPSQRYYSYQEEDLQSQDPKVLRSQAAELIILNHDLNRSHQNGMFARLQNVEPI